MPIISLGNVMPMYGITDNLESENNEQALSANQGRVLKNTLDDYKQNSAGLYSHARTYNSETHTHTHVFAGESILGYCKCEGTYIFGDMIVVNGKTIPHITNAQKIVSGAYISFIIDNDTLLIFGDSMGTNLVNAFSDNIPLNDVRTWLSCIFDTANNAMYYDMTAAEIEQDDILAEQLMSSENAREYFMRSPRLIQLLLHENSSIVRALEKESDLFLVTPNMTSLASDDYTVYNSNTRGDSGTSYVSYGAWSNVAPWNSSTTGTGKEEWTELQLPYAIWPYKIVGRTGETYNLTNTSIYAWEVFDADTNSWITLDSGVSVAGTGRTQYNKTGYTKKSNRFRIRCVNKVSTSSSAYASAQDNHIYGIL